jgi:DNA (cytosine-5)-methyltransferase 1
VIRPLLLDLFCGAGGAAVGYHRAGFEVIGVDLHPQPNYPFSFVRDDALAYLDENGTVGFDAIHASPPCHAYVQWNGVNRKRSGRLIRRPDLVAATRRALRVTGLPWVIENVVGAPMESPIILCGSMFSLGVCRHRLFESNVPMSRPSCCRHSRNEVAVYGDLNGRLTYTRADGTEIRVASTIGQARSAMGIDWMRWTELTQAIPPAYTEWVGKFLMDDVRGRNRKILT